VADKTIIEILRRRLRADKRPLLQVAKAAALDYGNLYRFRQGRGGMTLESAGKLAAVLGLELRPRKGR